ncbi:invasion associated locus B family protein [Paramagnetospirillum marisnigri]|nr:invasion associated locus B family protein [Paramagnetospirillum marisnigri]
MRRLALALLLAAAPWAAIAAEEGKAYGDWRVACEPRPEAKGQACHLFQNQMVQGGQRLLLVRIGKLGPKAEPMIVAEVPLGLDLTLGAAAKIDPGPQVNLRPLTCTPDGCRMAAGLDDTALKAMTLAKGMVIGIVPFGRTEVLQMPVSVNGLAEGLGAIK